MDERSDKRRPRRPHLARARRVSITAAVLLVLSGAMALAWTAGTVRNPGNAVTAATLADPPSVTATKQAGFLGLGCSSVTLSWQASPAPVNTYMVQRRVATDTEWTTLDADLGAVTSFHDSNPLDDSMVYRVAGRYKAGATMTNWTSAAVETSTVHCGLTATIGDLHVTGTGCMSASLAWDAVPGVVRYEGRYSVDGGQSWSGVVNLGTTTSWNASYGAFIPGGDVAFQIRAVTRVLIFETAGDWSNTAVVSDLDCVVGDLAGTASCFSVSLGWSPTAGASTYQRQYSTDGGTSWQDGGSGSGTTWHYGGSGDGVQFRVRAGTSGGAYGSWSVTIVDVPPGCAITTLAATSSCSGVSLTWSPVAGATTYQREYSTNGGATWQSGGSGAATSWNYSGTGTGLKFRVRPGTGGNYGAWSNVVGVDDAGFYVISIEIFGDGDDRMESGERIVVTFNRDADTTRPSGTGHDRVYIPRNDRALWIASDSNGAGSSAIGGLLASNDFARNNATVTGWASWNGTTRTWTWTKGNGNTNLRARPNWTGFTVGTSGSNPARVRCSDNATLLSASSPVITGRF